MLTYMPWMLTLQWENPALEHVLLHTSETGRVLMGAPGCGTCQLYQTLTYTTLQPETYCVKAGGDSFCSELAVVLPPYAASHLSLCVFSSPLVPCRQSPQPY